jgi:hypothetical protein
MIVALILGLAWLGIATFGWAACAITRKCDAALDDVEFYQPPLRRGADL